MPSDIAGRLAAAEAWLKDAPESHYVIQLLRIDASRQSSVEFFLANGVKGLDPAQLRVYRSDLSGRDRFGVIYGEFPTLEAAQSELARLTESNLVGNGAYVRPVGKLK